MPLDHLLLDVIFNDLLSFSSLLICKRISFASNRSIEEIPYKRTNLGFYPIEGEIGL